MNVRDKMTRIADGQYLLTAKEVDALVRHVAGLVTDNNSYVLQVDTLTERVAELEQQVIDDSAALCGLQSPAELVEEGKQSDRRISQLEDFTRQLAADLYEDNPGEQAIVLAEMGL